MSRITRLLKIGHVIAKYRLDSLIPSSRLPWHSKLALSLCKLYPQQTSCRGERLRKALEELGPIFVKFGQLLSTRPDVIPADIANELNKLQDNVAPYPSQTFVQLVEAELGQPISEIFSNFDTQPLASASVAQVHSAKLQNGRDVVVKAIRPGIDRIIEQDLSLLFSLAKLLEKFSPDGKRLRPVEVVDDYQHTIRDELDLKKEAANTATLRENFTPDEISDLLYVPEVIWDYSRQSVMVEERINGIPVTDVEVLKKSGVNLKALSERGVEIFFTQVFKHNFFHADMHPGNIFVSPQTPDKPQYIAIDCAIVGTLAKNDLYYLARNLLAVFQRDYRLVAELHVQCGWVPKDTPINAFESAIRSVCAPIFQKPLSEISLAQVLVELFQTARRFNMTVQPQLVLLQKTLLNVEGLGRQLYPDLDLWQTAQPFLEAWLKQRFHPASLFRELKRYGPDWMEQFPEIPNRIFNSLGQLEKLESLPQQIQKLSTPPKTQNKIWLKLTGLASIAGAIYLSNPQSVTPLFEATPAAMLLGAVGLLTLTFA